MNVEESKIRQLKALQRILNAHTESRDLIHFILSRPDINAVNQAFLREKYEEYNANWIPATKEKMEKIENDLSRLRTAAEEWNHRRKRELELLIAGEKARLNDEEKTETLRKYTLMLGACVFIAHHLRSLHQKRQSRKRIQRAQAELAILNHHHNHNHATFDTNAII